MTLHRGSMLTIAPSATLPGQFPLVRPRRRRRTAAMRALVREHRLSPDQLILPLFVCHGASVRRPVSSMPGVAQLSVDAMLDRQVDEAVTAGLRAVLLFGLPSEKDAIGSENVDPDGIVPRAVRRIKERHPDLCVITDLCCCEYTSHGHCGILQGESIDNDATLEVLGRAALAHASAGADVVAPSGMMDGMVSAIRAALDGEGYADTAILSYAVKYASAFYGPFREAAGSTPAFGDRRQYQMDPANAREALLEARLDEAEGADFLMIKPGLAYLDVMSAVRAQSELPLVAYSVSGEYAMIKAAAERGWIDERSGGARVADRHASRRGRRHHDLPCDGRRPVALGWAAMTDLLAAPAPAEHSPIGGALRPGPAPAPRWRQQSGARVPCGGRHPTIHRPRVGPLAGGCGRTSVSRPGAVLGSADPWTCGTRGGAGDHRGRRPRHDLRRALRTGDPARRTGDGDLPRHGHGPVRQFRHRGDHECAAAGAGRDGAYAHRQIRRLLPRPCRCAARRGGLGQWPRWDSPTLPASPPLPWRTRSLSVTTI